MISANRIDDTSVQEMLDLYKVMLTIRTFEVKVKDLFAAGKLPGFVHLSIGQEAIAAGVCSLLEHSDHITTTHRGHGHCIAKGGKILAMMAELYGRGAGYGKGRSGSMHIADSTVGILGANAIVGANIPIALGAAYSSQVLSNGSVSVAFFGEGAVAEGVFHESMNLAALWKLPLIFVCENNGYSELTPMSTHLSAAHVSDFGQAYGIPSSHIDGNDVLAVRNATRAAVDRARLGEGPTLLEFKTTRVRGHFEGDPQHYRTPEELKAAIARDPIASYRSILHEKFNISSDLLGQIDVSVENLIEDAVVEAESMELTPVEWIEQDVYQASAQLGGI